MHLLITHASALSDSCRHTLEDLNLPQLAALLSRLEPTMRSEADEFSLSTPHERALAQALGLAGPDGGLPWAAHLAAQDGIETGDISWGLLTPAHWHVGVNQVTMLDPEALGLDEAESREFLEVLRPLFESEGWALVWGAPTRWYAAHESLTELPTASLDRVIGRNVDAWMPDDAQARVLRRLQQEVQMLLYTHPLNERREARGLLPVNSFWLSGCGPQQAAKADPQLVVETRLRAGLMNDDWAAWAQAWRELDVGPVREALGALRAGQPVRLTLCGERSAQSFEPATRGLWQQLRSRLSPVQAGRVLSNL
jgi:hypothetical protein